MIFDSNRAWQDAMAAVRANREVLLALAGVFFLLPTLLSTMFLTDIQSRMLANMNKPQAMDQLMQENAGRLLGFGVGGLLVQLVGFVAVMALLSDRGRPTVGQAIARGLGGLPTLVATGIAFIFAVLVFSGLVSAIIGGLAAVLGAPLVGLTVAVAAVLLGAACASVKLSLVLPVIVREHVRNPFAAIARSWRLTRGNTLRLLGFYIVLAIGYVVVAMVASFVLLGPVLLLVGQGQGSLLAIGLVSGVLAGASSVILTALLAQTHRQLAGTDFPDAADTFE